ncbi:MAG: amidophosphoribosyltransferase [Bacteroidetes bacterium]|nr:amidophosphoribosyltransferase [Bacteroidota bacterium]
MSDPIKHECGIALIRLLQPLEYYQEKYGSALYGLKKLYLLMEKQHNRGQDGAGVATIKLDPEPGGHYINRERSEKANAVSKIFSKIYKNIPDDKEKLKDTKWLKAHAPYVGELLLGHLRYGTHGVNSIDKCHPFIRDNNWMSRTLVLAGNFNLTNVDELFDTLVDLGQHPIEKADTVTVLEKIGHFLDEEVQDEFEGYKSKLFDNLEITQMIAKSLNIGNVLKRATKKFDGGYAIAGMIGHGDAFVLRDPNGIRPVFYYQDDEIAVVTSERPAIQTAFNVPIESIKELTPGHALIIKKSGTIFETEISKPLERKSCSFERIYFSRGNDADIYKERKMLGRLLSPIVLRAVDHDIRNTVFSYIPNTAATSFYGMIDGILSWLDEYKQEKILEAGENFTPELLQNILSLKPRREKIAVKDVKLRTFITDDSNREDLVAHVYDVTYGIINKDKDNLVVIDDSIVRGTTLKNSIIRILDRLHPKNIVIVSSAPQIRYPDCYGIDMSKLGEFVAFQAMVALLKETKQEYLMQETYQKCIAAQGLPKEEQTNLLKPLYDLFTDDQLTEKISEILTPEGINAKVQVIYQTIENLHVACPDHNGDWYFSGNYPTPGGNRVVNKSFINYMEGNKSRAY